MQLPWPVEFIKSWPCLTLHRGWRERARKNSTGLSAGCGGPRGCSKTRVSRRARSADARFPSGGSSAMTYHLLERLHGERVERRLPSIRNDSEAGVLRVPTA